MSPQTDPTRWDFLVLDAKLIQFVESRGRRVICFTFHRTDEEQLKEYEAGRSQVKSGGKHQKWMAKDYAVWEDIDQDGTVDTNEIRWNWDPFYTEMGEYWESIGGRWGGRFNQGGKIGFADPYHFEL